MDLHELNGDDRCLTALLPLPGTHNKVRLLFGFGTAGIGKVSPLANKLLALFGEGGVLLGCPHVVLLDQTMRQIAQLVAPTDAEIEATFAARHTLDKPTHRATNVATTV